MNLGSITFNDTNAVTLSGPGNYLTLNSTSTTAAATSGALSTITNTGTGISAISVTSFANATNTIALWPGQLTSVWALRTNLRSIVVVTGCTMAAYFFWRQ